MNPDPDDRVTCRLTALPVALREAGFEPIDYLAIRAAAINGTIPAHQRRHVWHYFAEDTRQIASALKLTPLAKARQAVAA